MKENFGPDVIKINGFLPSRKILALRGVSEIIVYSRVWPTMTQDTSGLLSVFVNKVFVNKESSSLIYILSMSAKGKVE